MKPVTIIAIAVVFGIGTAGSVTLLSNTTKSLRITIFYYTC